jgi:hypothetical protein
MAFFFLVFGARSFEVGLTVLIDADFDVDFYVNFRWRESRLEPAVSNLVVRQT